MLFILIVVLFFSVCRNVFSASETVPDQGKLDYYLKLRKEEFLQTMVYKEKFLLGMAQNVNDELWARRSEGVQPSDMGVDLLLSPKEVLAKEYTEEMMYLADLLDEIKKLEKRARQTVDFEALDRLNKLKNRVGDIIQRQTGINQTGIELSGKEGGHTESQTDTAASYRSEDKIDTVFVNMKRAEELFDQWKYNRLLDYMHKVTQYNFLRIKLINTANTAQKKRMFQRDLRTALETFSDGDFFLARMQLKDVLDTYSDISKMDDVQYYYCESCYGLNYMDEALAGYTKLIKEYPRSDFRIKSLMRVIGINFIYGDVANIFENYQTLLYEKSRIDVQSLGVVTYLVGYAYFKSGLYGSALHILQNVSPKTTYYYPARYLIGACHSNLNQEEQAVAVYQALAELRVQFKKDPMLFQIRNNALLKLGLIYYERGENQVAMSYFDRVSKDYNHYDLNLIAKAWSTYRSGQHDETLKNVEGLLQNSLLSNYAYEAKVLAASSNEVLGHTDRAMDDLRQVYMAGQRVSQTGSLAAGRAAMTDDVNELETWETAAFHSRYDEILSEIRKVSQFLHSGEDSEFSVPGPERSDAEVKQEKKLKQEIRNLEMMEKQARTSQRNDLLGTIRELKSELIGTLNEHSRSSSGEYGAYDDPIIQRMGMAEYLRYLCRSLITETLREKEKTRTDIKNAKKLIQEAESKGQFSIMVQMEMKKTELEDYYGRLNQYEVWLRENFPQDIKLDLDQWASFSGYGISNINFSRIKEVEQKIADISGTISALDHVYEVKRVDLQNRIQGLLSDVVKIEDQMRKEADKKEQLEKERFFKVEYFYKQQQESPAGKLEEKPKPGGTGQNE